MPMGSFEQAIYSVKNRNEGVGNGERGAGQHPDPFSEQISQALALQLNLATSQQANERALAKLTKTKNGTGGLKQTLQARAAIYGNLLDPT